MKIKEGFDSKPLSIRISPASTNRMAEVWIEQEGLMIPLISPKTKEIYTHQSSETLAYATLEEVLQLRDECNYAIKEMTGL